MPTYEYECTSCGKVFELFQSITAKAKRRVRADEKNCECEASVRRLIGTGAGVIFKGAGFYETDYRSDSYKKAAKADKDSVSGADSKSDSKKTSDSKNDNKPASKSTSSDKKSKKDSAAA